MSDDGLAGFLRARLDEDEAAANEVHRPRDCGSVNNDGEFDPDPIYCSCPYPARVLREAEAKRAILALHPPKPLRHVEADWCHVCRTGWPCKEFRAIAAVYSDHPDYRPEWKP